MSRDDEFADNQPDVQFMPLNSPMGQKFIKRMIDILVAEKRPSDLTQKDLFHQTLGKLFGQKTLGKTRRRKP